MSRPLRGESPHRSAALVVDCPAEPGGLRFPRASVESVARREIVQTRGGGTDMGQRRASSNLTSVPEPRTTIKSTHPVCRWARSRAPGGWLVCPPPSPRRVCSSRRSPLFECAVRAHVQGHLLHTRRRGGSGGGREKGRESRDVHRRVLGPAELTSAVHGQQRRAEVDGRAPVSAAVIGPTVEPHGRSVRTTNDCSGTPACSQASRNAAAPASRWRSAGWR